MTHRLNVLDHGFVTLRNIAGPVRRSEQTFDADDTDPANAARFSFDAADKEDRPKEADLKLAEYLLKNGHTTPFEMTEVWLEMKMPIFVARQFVRHRTVSLNEVSARYVQLPADFYIPDPKTVGVKGKTQKQGREIVDAENIQAIKFCKQLADESNRAYKNYEEALSSGIPNELARCYLPLNIYTSWLWHQDLHNMIHFLKLRLHSHTQYESRQYAEAIYTLLKSVLPYTMELFDKYNRVEK